ncbi:crotonase/enoyl-CoA hydratase family protein [Amycolatopsis acidiphila]|uniref:Crotonase/enoyl-CoA hydratase family protein n=1 Tax=Amycolatopsis acidiphila TaxID=715473 RepID=A0A558ALX1_9PSEU|nr:crotonase/enoyl-CoA hydratase family protein [Amycolatopsis acidiphila]TVT25211.1 crotonase/enoyl-CoA hydratase family protein [Amycolatopsis acidiphila]UIJ62325.1 crotonase/enoyl-CoA hydratase family protein [Amycolatopsis acidiphila]GHG83054.1 enoyl CoA dehydratase/isomerase [Amycolatopsis acidiphila]
MADEVRVEERGRILVITINRPKARNAINAAVTASVAAALDLLDERHDLSLGILTGADGTFCAGMDLKAFLAGEVVSIPGRGLAGMTERPPKKPMIAAVEGYALAGGCELALACDLVVASEEAKFGIPEVKRGLVAAAGGLLRLPRRIPPQLAMEYALTGDFFPAGDAHRYGLVNHLTKPGGALEGAFALAERITANAPLAIQATKEIITRSADWHSDEAFTQQQAVVQPVFQSADAQEGARAFAEKRAPVWRGE